MEFLKNISVNLRATGPAAVLIAWIAAITAIGLFGEGDLAKSAIQILAFAGGMILIGLASKA